jgi:sugar phosphate isomerase/epimerase
LGRWVVNLHLKDYRALRLPHGKGFLVEGRPAGQGQLDLPAILEDVAGCNPGLNAIAELWVPPAADLADTIARERTWAAESVRYLRQFLKD